MVVRCQKENHDHKSYTYELVSSPSGIFLSPSTRNRSHTRAIPRQCDTSSQWKGVGYVKASLRRR